MKKINKILVLSFSFIFALGMTACDNDTSESNSTSVEEPSSTPSQNTPSDTSTPSIEDTSSSTPSVDTSDTESSTPTHTHNLTKVDAVSATCTTDGNIEYYTCDGCEEIFSDAQGTTKILVSETVVSKTGHELTAVPEVPASCSENGVKAYWTCSGCDVLFADPMGMTTTNLEQLVIPAAHNISHHTAVAATCTTAGNIEYWHCSGCETYYSDAQGSTTITQQETITPALGHNMTHHAANSATCTEDGNVEYWTCGTCDKYFTDENGNTETSVTDVVLSKNGHNLEHKAPLNATCTTDGVREHWFCDVCDKYFRDENAQTETSQASTIIAASGHNMTHQQGHAATCTEDGSKEYWTCDQCNNMYLDEEGTTITSLTGIYLAPNGHTLSKVEATTPTCEEYGYIEHYVCANCPEYFKDADGTIPATLEEVRINKAHNMTHHEAVAKTCTTEGRKEYWQCGTCEDIFLEETGNTAVTEDDLVIPAGHNLTAHEANAATCTVNGNIAYWTCEDCHKYFTDENAENETTLDATVIVASHNMDHHDAAEANCTDPGNIEYWYCEKCDGYYLDENGSTATTLVEVTIPATGHSQDTALEITEVVDGVATVFRSCTNGCNASNVSYEIAVPTLFNGSIVNDQQLAEAFKVTKDSTHTFNFIEEGMMKNTNAGKTKTNSIIELTAKYDGTFTFDVAIWSEANYDYLKVFKNNSEIWFSKTDISGISNNAEGTASLSFELKVGDVLKLDKRADDSGFYGPTGDQDYCKITNMAFTPAAADAQYAIIDFESNGGSEVTPVITFEGFKLDNLPIPTKAGYVFTGWYTDAALETPVTKETIATLTTKLYASWFDEANAIATFGEYVGYNVYGDGYVGESKYTLSIDVLGNTSGYMSDTMALDSETGTYKFVTSSKEIKYHQNGIMIISSSDTDLYVFVRTSADEVTMKSAAFKDAEGNYTIKLIEYTISGETTALLVKDGQIYDAVTYSSIFTTIDDVSDIDDISDIVIKDVDGNVVLSVGYNGSTYVELDSAYGIYTNENETLKVSGLGAIDYNGVAGTYTVENDVACAYIDGTYYEFTLSNEMFTVAIPVVKVTYVAGEGHNPIPSATFNKNIAVELPVLEEANYVFNGWFYNAEFTSKVEAEFIPTENVTLYAKWSAPAILTINPNNGEDVQEVIYSVGDTTDIENPKAKGFVFAGWYTTATFEEGSEWANGEITVDTVIYAKWDKAPAYNNEYVATRVTGTRENGGTGDNTYTYEHKVSGENQYAISIEADGTGYSYTNPYRGNITIENFNKETGYLEIVFNTDVYKGYVDPNTGIIVHAYLSNRPLNQVIILNPFEKTNIKSSISESYWNGGYSRAIQYTYDGVTYSIFVHNEVVYFGTTFKTAEGTVITAKECYNSPSVVVYDANENIIAEFKHDGTKLCELDGLQGTYTNGTDTLVLDGVATVTLNGVEGTYSVATDSEYTLNVYVANTYYEVTLTENLFTMNKPMVTITYNYNYDGSVNSQVSVNKNIGMTLEIPEREGYVFKGWMTTADGTASDVDSEITPEADVEYFALWAEKVVVTIYYGNGLGVGYEDVAKGEIPGLNIETTFKDGYAFAGWYTTSTHEEGTEYTFTAIEESMNVYAKWIESVAQYGSYAGANIYGSSTSGSTIQGGSSNQNVTIDPLGNVSGGRKNGSVITDYDPVSGTFIIGDSYGHYDSKNGVMIYNYGSGTTGINADMMIIIKNADSASSSSSSACYWDSGKTKLVKFNITSETYGNREMVVFVYQNKVYGNVTFDATPINAGDEITTANAYNKAQTLDVYDSDGNLIASFEHDSTIGLKEVVSEPEQPNPEQPNPGEGHELAGKTFVNSFENWDGNHTVTLMFDANGTGTSSFVCDGFMADVSLAFGTANSFTYTVEADIVTVIVTKEDGGSNTFTFTLDNVANPTTLTCVTSTLEYDNATVTTGTVFTVN